MRAATLFACFCLAAVGCQGVGLRKPLLCEPFRTDAACEGRPPAAPCPPPAQVEVQRPPDVQVTAPAPKVIVNVPEATVVTAPAAPAVQYAPAAPAMQYAPAQAPAAYPAPATMMVPQAASPMMYPGAAYPQPGMVASTTQTISQPKTRIAISLETIKIPFPCLRLIPIAGPSEVTTTTQFAPAQQFVQPVAVMPQPTQVAVQPQVLAQPAVVMPQPTQVAVQPQFVAQPAALAVQPAPQPVQPQPVRPAVAACPPVTRQTIEMLQSELDKAKQQLNASQPQR